MVTLMQNKWLKTRFSFKGVIFYKRCMYYACLHQINSFRFCKIMLEKNIPSVTQRGTQSKSSSVEHFSFLQKGADEQVSRHKGAGVLMQVVTLLVGVLQSRERLERKPT